MPDRVILFLDYQNVYRGAREAFCEWNAPHWEGQVDPLRLAVALLERDQKGRNRTLHEVRVYRGQPDATKDPKGYGASSRQCHVWEQLPAVRVFTRTLRYPQTWPQDPPEEKGIDVALAVDFVMMAVRGEYDVGILMSTDTDLKPALEAVTGLDGPICEVAAWSSPHGHSRRLSIRSPRLWCHWLDEGAYRRCADPTDYVRP